MRRITTYAEFQALKAMYRNSQIVSVSDNGALIFIRKQKREYRNIAQKIKERLNGGDYVKDKQ